MNCIKKLFSKNKKQCDITVSKSDIEQHCMKLWAKSDGTWEHYLAAKEYEKILAKKHLTCRN